MSMQLGIGLGGDALRGVVVEGGAVRWRGSVPLSGVASIAASLASLLSGAPPRIRRATAHVAVAPAWVQVKALHGLPPVKQHRLATQIVRENQRAFFLARGGPIVIADVWTRSDGTTWGAAFDREAVSEITAALRAAGHTVGRMVPSVVAIAGAHPGKALSWSDAGEHLHIEGDANGLIRLERVVDPAQAEPIDDAEAAVATARRAPLTWRPDPDARRTRMLQFARVASAASAVMLAAAFTLLGPGLRAVRFTRAADGELANSRGFERELAGTEGDLRKTTETLNRIAAFQASRGGMSRTLAELSQALPDSTAVLAFHVDSAEGGFTAIAPHIAEVMPQLTEASEVLAPRIVGSVTRETIGGARVERAAFRFRRPNHLQRTKSR